MKTGVLGQDCRFPAGYLLYSTFAPRNVNYLNCLNLQLDSLDLLTGDTNRGRQVQEVGRNAGWKSAKTGRKGPLATVTG